MHKDLELLQRLAKEGDEEALTVLCREERRQGITHPLQGTLFTPQLNEIPSLASRLQGGDLKEDLILTWVFLNALNTDIGKEWVTSFTCEPRGRVFIRDRGFDSFHGKYFFKTWPLPQLWEQIRFESLVTCWGWSFVIGEAPSLGLYVRSTERWLLWYLPGMRDFIQGMKECFFIFVPLGVLTQAQPQYVSWDPFYAQQVCRQQPFGIPREVYQLGSVCCLLGTENGFMYQWIDPRSRKPLEYACHIKTP